VCKHYATFMSLKKPKHFLIYKGMQLMLFCHIDDAVGRESACQTIGRGPFRDRIPLRD
jgi:hypothetical protein